MHDKQLKNKLIIVVISENLMIPKLAGGVRVKDVLTSERLGMAFPIV